MLINAQNLTSQQIIEADLCIIGAGAAGIAAAREFLNADIKVILLESGGLDFNHHAQFLYRGVVEGRWYTSPEFTRRRQFGGSTATWFGRCHPLDRDDFEERDWIPHSGWPISAAELRPFYEQANRLFEIDNYDYTPNLRDMESGLELKKFSFSPPTKFGEKYRAEIKQSSNLQVLLNATALHIQLNNDGSQVDSVRCTTLFRKRFSVRARFFILALGGLETPRLMLASRDVQKNGIGNQNDLLGRYFMEHVSLFDAHIDDIPAHQPRELFKLDYSIEQKNLGNVLAAGLTSAHRQEHRLLNGCGFFVRRAAHKTDDLFYSKEMQDVIRLSEIIHHAAPPSLRAAEYLVQALSNSRKLLPAIKSGLFQRKDKPHYGLQMQLECVPNPESRLTLSDDKRDFLGIPRLVVRWKLSTQDLDSYHRLRKALFEGLTRIGLPIRPINHDLDEEGWPVSITPSKHHMGATRMHRDPQQGVVDEHCCVHGVHNLYIASSSTFPTSGMANPTLTIAALALRIANRVKTIMLYSPTA
jgi:choline dehydrogenase-like flavoprotein